MQRACLQLNTHFWQQLSEQFVGEHQCYNYNLWEHHLTLLLFLNRVESEDNMNCQLGNITLTARDGRVSNLEHAYIRGSKIRFLILPDMLKNAPMFKRVEAGKSSGRGRGLGLGRGRAGAMRGGRGNTLSLFFFLSSFIFHFSHYYVSLHSKRIFFIFLVSELIVWLLPLFPYCLFNILLGRARGSGMPTPGGGGAPNVFQQRK